MCIGRSRHLSKARSSSNGSSSVVTVAAAATFSAWIDLTDSSATYVSNQQCDGKCTGVGSQSFAGPAGIGQFRGTRLDPAQR